MKSVLLTAVQSLLLVSLALTLFGCGPKYPTTYEALAVAFEEAHRAQDVEAANQLIFWASMPESEQARILDGIETSFEKTLAASEVKGLPDDFTMVAGTYVFPFEPEKELEVSYENPGQEGGVLVGMAFKLGMQDGRSWIVYRSEDVEAPADQE